MTTLAFVVGATGKGDLLVGPLVGGLCVIKATSTGLFAKAKQGRLEYDDIQSIFGFTRINQEGEDKDLEWERQWWRYALDRDLDEETVSQYSNGFSLFRYGIDNRLRLVPIIANGIIDRIIPRSDS